MKTNRDPRLDSYTEKSAEFARPILRHLRALVREACPEAEEALKWGMPHFLHHGILCYMAAFKAHCGFGFRRQQMEELLKKDGVFVVDAMGTFGRITSLKDLPDDKTMLRYIREAARLNEVGGPVRTRPKKPKPELKTPADLAAALRKYKTATAVFEKFAPSHRREYIQWITEAKRPETREKRVASTIDLLTKGKSRHWEYQS